MLSNPHRLAWVTIAGAFAAFLVICAGAGLFARWLLMESPVQLGVTLHVSRGTVGLAEPDQTGEQAIRSPVSVTGRDTLSTDSESQGYLSVIDQYSDTVIATILMRNDSSMTLATANRPRFNLSEKPYTIRVTELNGSFEVWVSRDLDREIRLDIASPLGTTRISDQGLFLIESTPVALRVTAKNGDATLISKHDGSTQHIAVDHVGAIKGETQTMTLSSAPTELLKNSLFNEGLEGDWPVGWVCGFVPRANDAVRGEYSFVTEDGRPVVHIERMQSDPQPGDMACFQSLGGPDGLDVTQYDSVRLHVTMRVDYQSLSQCGVAGSECPVMLQITYNVPGGVTRDWYHGFFIERRADEGRDVCDSCLQPHEQIAAGTWYSYESGNLLIDLPETWRPTSIKEVKFYAGGHQYDVVISEVSLIATNNAPENPTVATD